MITKVKFTNYKLLRDVEFPLGKLNVIVGANGVGKSSALEALSLLTAAHQSLLQNRSGLVPNAALEAVFVGDYARDKLVSRPHAEDVSLGVEASADHRVRLEMTTPKAIAHLTSGSFKLSYHGSLGDHGLDTRNDHDHEKARALAHKMQQAGLGVCVLLRLDALRLRDAHYSPERDLRIAFDGEGLASVLQRIQITRDGRLEAIEKEVVRCVPLVRRIRTTQEPVVRTEHVPVTIDGKHTVIAHTRKYVGAGFEVEGVDFDSGRNEGTTAESLVRP